MFSVEMHFTNLLLFCSCISASQITITLKHKWDCSGVYACIFGRPVDMPACARGWTFSLTARRCVQHRSDLADCIHQNVFSAPDCATEAETDRCALGGITAHPTECQAFYNCSGPSGSPGPGFYGYYRQECTYPQLFDADDLRCKHFEYVRCGDRREYKNACDYRDNQCHVSHCIPCNVRFSNCEGKPNGPQPRESSTWSPYFAVCYKERFVSLDTCLRDSEGWTQFFHPELNECVPLYMIPKERGGALPDCRNRSDGFYQDDFGRCDRYTVCLGSQFLDRGKCSVGEVFDSVRKACGPVADTCGRCGKAGC